MLSQGRVDGTGGRGFYSGLGESLGHILESLMAAPGVADLLRLTEGIFHPVSSNQNTIIYKDDILVSGIWKPVTTVLAERYHGMFSVGVAVAMHRAFTALEQFAREIPRTFLLTSDSTGNIGGINRNSGVTIAYARLCRHPDVVAFRNKWKLDLYFQVTLNYF